ncbi:MAG: hypothetical protein Kow0047_13540 [Anaerolineae bacterium]
MRDELRRHLKALLRQHGLGLLDDEEALRRGLETLSAAGFDRELFVLLGAWRQRVPQSLLALGDEPIGQAVASLTRDLQDRLALTADAARWAVESWAWALGVIESPVADEEWVVAADGTGRFTTIMAAVRSAPAGSRVLIRPGRYDEGVVIEKRLELIADGPPEAVIVESTNAPCLSVAAEGVRVVGLTLRSSVELRGSKYYAVDVSRGDALLERCDITSDAWACVAVHGPGASAVLRQCRIHDGQGFGVSVYDGAGAILEGCRVSDNRYAGIEVRGRAQVTLRRCRVEDNAGEGVWAYDEGAVTLEHCDITGNARGSLSIEQGITPVIVGGQMDVPPATYQPRRVNGWRIALTWALLGALVLGLIVRDMSGLMVGGLIGLLIGGIIAGIASGVLTTDRGAARR